MEDLAHGLVANNVAGLISKVYDEYLDVIALDSNLYTLNINESFIAYNDPKMKESDIRQYISRLTIGLISLVRILGVLPIIRAPCGGPAEMLASELCNTLRECLSPRGSAHSIFGDFLVSDRPRPLLLIVDRTSDLTSPLLHASTYQALVDDLLDYHLNKVSVMVTNTKTGSNSNPTKKTYDLNTQLDPFFSQYSGASFPDAVEAHEKELAAVSKREAEIRSTRPSSSSSSNTNELLDSTLLNTNTSASSLSEAITSLPEILAKKANLEAHANILQAVMKEIAAREVPTFFELEQTILQNNSIVDRVAILSLLREGIKGTISDRARLLALVILLIQSSDKSSTSNSTIEEHINAFCEGCNVQQDSSNESNNLTKVSNEEEMNKMLASINFLRKLHKLQSPMGGYGGGFGSSGSEGKSSAIITNFLSNATRYAANSIAMLSGSTFTALPITRIVENLSEGKSCQEDEQYSYFDPRLPANQQTQSKVIGQKYGEVVVFVIGGGCLMEHSNLQELLQQKKKSSVGTGQGSLGVSGTSTLRNVIYGGSEIYSSEVFFKQLYQLSGGSTNNGK